MVKLIAPITAFFALVITSAASAVPQNYTVLTDGFAAELGAAVPVALTAVGLFVGILLAYKVIRRMLRA